MSKKLIIHIEEGIDEKEALDLVRQVVAKGRVSNERGRQTFCFVTTFHYGPRVSCKSTSEGTDTFWVDLPSREREPEEGH